MPAAQPTSGRQTSTSGAQTDEPATAAAAPSKAETVRGASSAAGAIGNGTTAAKHGKATKRKHSRPEAAAPGAAETDGAAAVQSSLEAAGVEVVPVTELRASEAAGANGAAPGEPPFRNREKVLMLTSRGIPPRYLS